MSLTQLLTQAGTHRKQRDGAGVPGPDIDAAVSCRFRAQQNAGDHSAEPPWVLILGPTISIDARDLWVYAADIFEILPDPVAAESPRGAHHLTVHCLPLPDVCTIRSDGGLGAFDENDLTYTENADSVVHASVPCRLTPWQSPERIVTAGEEPKSLRTYELAVPWSKTGISLGHLVTIDSSLNPDIVGVGLTVIDVAGSSAAAAQRLVVRDERRTS